MKCSVAGLVTENVVRGMDRNEAHAMFIIPQVYVQFPISYSQVCILFFFCHLNTFILRIASEFKKRLLVLFTPVRFCPFTRLFPNEIHHNEDFNMGIDYRAFELSCSHCPCF